jgi:hypothetical protein
MSKRLAIKGVAALTDDLFGTTKTAFKLIPPESFAFFNSLRLGETDSFAGVTVILADSRFWRTEHGLVSELGEGQDVIYAGTFSGEEAPEGVSEGLVDRWIIVASRELGSRPGTYREALGGQGCTYVHDKEAVASMFVFLRANNLLSFDESLREDATHGIASAPEDTHYVGTSVEELSRFYERFDMFKMGEASSLNAQSIFWISYLVAAGWSDVKPAYWNADARAYLQRIYDEALWHFPIDNARTAIASSHFKHCFVELYRCLEWLYALPQARAVKRKLGLTEKATVLAREFRAELGWRRRERESLALLLRDAQVFEYPLFQLNKCLLAVLAPRPGHGDSDEQHEKWTTAVVGIVADRLYAIRNQFVHQLEEADVQIIERESEPFLIELLCWLCATLYEVYAIEF